MSLRRRWGRVFAEEAEEIPLIAVKPRKLGHPVVEGRAVACYRKRYPALFHDGTVVLGGHPGAGVSWKRMFATLKMLFVYTALGPLAGVIGIPYTLVVGNISRLYRVAMWIMRAGVTAAGIRVELSGMENVPVGRSCIFLSNHVSNLDPPVLLPALPGRTSVLLKRELMRIPILGTAMRMAQFVPVDRGSRRDAAAASVTAAAAALKAGLNILIYPEGTRAVDGRLQKFKKGPFYLAYDTGAPIVPVLVMGTERMMGKGTAKIRPGVAKVRFLRAIMPGEYGSREELMGAVRAAMVAELPEGMRPVEAVGSG